MQQVVGRLVSDTVRHQVELRLRRAAVQLFKSFAIAVLRLFDEPSQRLAVLSISAHLCSLPFIAFAFQAFIIAQ